MKYMLSVVDPSGVEQFLGASDDRGAILARRDTLRRHTSHVGRFYRLCDQEGREVERDDETC